MNGTGNPVEHAKALIEMTRRLLFLNASQEDALRELFAQTQARIARSHQLIQRTENLLRQLNSRDE